MKNIDSIKGIHPGLFLNRELKRRNLSKRSFALSIDEFPQLLGDITNGKRRMNPSLSIRIGKALGFDENFFSVLQAYYDVRIEKEKSEILKRPNLDIFRPALFWDTELNSINWIKSRKSIIRRVFTRGSMEEILEILRFYGAEEVSKILAGENDLPVLAKRNMQKYL